jgi:steroid delta-isomerase-like uncharacterized protein
MSSEKVVIEYYQAFNSKKIDLMLSYLADDVIHDTNQGSRTVGKKEFQKFMQEMNKFYDEHLDQIVVMVSSDQKRVAAEFVCQGIYKSTAPGLPPAKGQQYQIPVGCFFEIKDRKIARVTNYYNLNEWLKQVQ